MTAETPNEGEIINYLRELQARLGNTGELPAPVDSPVSGDNTLSILPQDVESYIQKSEWSDEVNLLMASLALGDDASTANWAADQMLQNGFVTNPSARTALLITLSESPTLGGELKGDLTLEALDEISPDTVRAEAEQTFSNITNIAKDTFDEVSKLRKVVNDMEQLTADEWMELKELGNELQKAIAEGVEVYIAIPSDDPAWEEEGATKLPDKRVITASEFDDEFKDDSSIILLPTTQRVHNLLIAIVWEEGEINSELLSQMLALLSVGDITTFSHAKGFFEDAMDSINQELFRAVLFRISEDIHYQDLPDTNPDKLRAQISMSTHSKLYFKMLASRMGLRGLTSDFMKAQGIDFPIPSWLEAEERKQLDSDTD